MEGYRGEGGLIMCTPGGGGGGGGTDSLRVANMCRPTAQLSPLRRK